LDSLTKAAMKDHVVDGAVAGVLVSFFIPKPFDVVVAAICSGIAVDAWVHKFRH